MNRLAGPVQGRSAPGRRSDQIGPKPDVGAPTSPVGGILLQNPVMEQASAAPPASAGRPHSGCRSQAYSRAPMWRSKASSSSVLQAA